MARILIAWQIGAGYGRLSQIAPVAAALRARGHHVMVAAPGHWLGDALASRLHERMPATGGIEWLESPDAFRSGLATGERLESWADMLRLWSFGEPGRLLAHVRQWHALMTSARPDAVLAHHAPGAILAAQMRGLPIGQFGDGYVVPLTAEPMPRLTPGLDRDGLSSGDLSAVEFTVLSSIQSVCASFGKPLPASLAQWLQSVPDYLCTWPFLDHYGERKEAFYYGVHRGGLNGAAVCWPQASGPEGDEVSRPAPRVLVYLSAGHPASEALRGALEALGWPAVMHQAWSDKDNTGHGDPPNVARYSEPIDLSMALSQAQVFVCHAPHLSCAEALQQGVPMLLLPTNVEQEMVATQIVKLGAGRAPDSGGQQDLIKALQTLAGDPAYAQRAAALALALKPFDATRAVAELAEDFCADMELSE